MYKSVDLLKMVNDTLDTMQYQRQPSSLYEPIRYVLSLGGKRIRPVLMMMSYNLFKERAEDIMNQAIALETYHNYTLLHDDLMDQADLRRGHVTVHKKWDANKAILSGDSMLVLSYERMAKCAENYLPAILHLFTETALEIGEGQEYDMTFETRNDVTEEEYIEMIRLKTSVLLACAMKIGAIMGDASEVDQNYLYQYGEKLGLAFQLQDDLLDVYGDPKVFGKAIGGDIMCNKKTYMLINAFNRANAEQRVELERWIGMEHPVREEKVAAVTTLFNSMGIRELCEQKIAYYTGLANDSLAKVNVPDERKEPLRQYALELMCRQK